MIEWHDPPTGGYCGSLVTSPLGSIWVVYTSTALVAAEFGDVVPTRFGSCSVQLGGSANWVNKLFYGAFAGNPPTQWCAIDGGLTALERALLSRASDVPFGTTMSYGMLADWAGYPGRARAAGRAMARSPIVYLIPTHRVIRADGHPAPSQRDRLNATLRHFERIDIDRRRGRIGRIQ